MALDDTILKTYQELERVREDQSNCRLDLQYLHSVDAAIHVQMTSLLSTILGKREIKQLRVCRFDGPYRLPKNMILPLLKELSTGAYTWIVQRKTRDLLQDLRQDGHLTNDEHQSISQDMKQRSSMAAALKILSKLTSETEQ